MAVYTPKHYLDRLIEVVQNYEHLYDQSNKDYKNNNKKEESWTEISQIVHMSVEKCKRHWKNLRDRFMREKREKQGGSSTSESTWVYFNKMSFYSKCCRPRKITLDMLQTTTPYEKPLKSLSSSPTWSGLETVMSQSDISQDTGEEEFASVKIEYGEEPEQETAEWETPIGNIMPLPKRIQSEVQVAAVMDVGNQFVNTFENTNKLPSQNESFVNYVLSRLKEMTPEEAKEKRRKMLRVLEDL